MSKNSGIKIYPAVFEPAEEGGYLVDFPDFDGNCYTEGDTLEEAFEMAQDVLAGTIINMSIDGDILPEASDIKSMNPSGDAFINYVEVDIIKYKNSELSKSVRKNVTIPAWLNMIVEARHVNVSGILQDALLEDFGLGFMKGVRYRSTDEIIEALKTKGLI